MTYSELQIQFDLNPDNRVNVLNNANTCRCTVYGYIFVDQEDGKCYLFDDLGNLDNISKIKITNDYIFTNCISLTSIKIPNSVKNIGECAFYKCEHLTNIEIPNSVKWIGYRAFNHCTSLTSIKIPNSVESIRYEVFYNCTSLKEVVFEGKTIYQVKAMKYYPWGIIDESVIKTES